MAGDVGSELSKGGMVTKIEAAKIAVAAGTHMVIASGKVMHPLQALANTANGDVVPGTLGPGDGAETLDRRHARAKRRSGSWTTAQCRRSPPARACSRPA